MQSSRKPTAIRTVKSAVKVSAFWNDMGRGTDLTLKMKYEFERLLIRGRVWEGVQASPFVVPFLQFQNLSQLTV